MEWGYMCMSFESSAVHVLLLFMYVFRWFLLSRLILGDQQAAIPVAYVACRVFLVFLCWGRFFGYFLFLLVCCSSTFSMFLRSPTA